MNDSKTTATQKIALNSFRNNFTGDQALLFQQLTRLKLVGSESYVVKCKVEGSITEEHCVVVTPMTHLRNTTHVVMNFVDLAPHIFIGLSPAAESPQDTDKPTVPVDTFIEIVAQLDATSAVDDSLEDDKVVFFQKNLLAKTGFSSCVLVNLESLMPELDGPWSFDGEQLNCHLVIPVTQETIDTIKVSGHSSKLGAWKKEQRKLLRLDDIAVDWQEGAANEDTTLSGDMNSISFEESLFEDQSIVSAERELGLNRDLDDDSFDEKDSELDYSKPSTEPSFQTALGARETLAAHKLEASLLAAEPSIEILLDPKAPKPEPNQSSKPAQKAIKVTKPNNLDDELDIDELFEDFDNILDEPEPLKQDDSPSLGAHKDVSVRNLEIDNPAKKTSTLKAAATAQDLKQTKATSTVGENQDGKINKDGINEGRVNRDTINSKSLNPDDKASITQQSDAFQSLSTVDNHPTASVSKRFNWSLQGRRQVIGETILSGILVSAGTAVTVAFIADSIYIPALIPACFAIGGALNMHSAIKEGNSLAE